MTIFIFFIVLFVLILVHEWGHFIVAKKTGMRVDEFGIGFPPKLFGIKKGETEYTINLLPVGGFVRIFGENAQDASLASKDGKDISGSFTSKSKWAQVAVLIAGVTMNVIFAWLLFVIVFVVGVPTAVDESTAGEGAALVVTSVVPNSPADEMGIPAGAKIISYTNKTDTEKLTPTDFRSYSSQMNLVPMDITYKEGGAEKTVKVVPQKGLIADNPEQPAVGISLSLIETVRKPIGTALIDASVTTYQSIVAITVGIFTLFVDIAQMDADLSQVAGPVGIVGLVGEAAEFGLASLLMFTAVISLNLAVINLLPFPALDGGRLLLVVIEAIIKKPINPVWVARLNTFGFLLLLLLMVAVTYSDIAKLLMK